MAIAQDSAVEEPVRLHFLPPLVGRVILVNKRTIFWGAGDMDAPHRRARHLGPGTSCFPPGQLSIEFVGVGAG